MVSPVTGWGAAPQMAGGQPASLGSLNTPELGWGVRPESLQRKSKVGTGAEMSPGPGGPPPPEIGHAGAWGAHVPLSPEMWGHVCPRVQVQPGHCFTLQVGLRSGPAQWRVHRLPPHGLVPSELAWSILGSYGRQVSAVCTGYPPPPPQAAQARMLGRLCVHRLTEGLELAQLHAAGEQATHPGAGGWHPWASPLHVPAFHRHLRDQG